MQRAKLLAVLILLAIGKSACEAVAGDINVDTKAPWMNIRLPDNLLPIEYDVDLRPILTENEQGVYIFIGSSTVTYLCKKPTKYVILHSNKLNYTADQVTLKTLKDGMDIFVADVFFHKPNQYVVVVTEKPCIQGELYNLSVSNFVAELADDLNGLYRSEYTATNGEKRIIATTQMQPTGARETFPCFEEPALKANYTVTLWYKANTGYFAASNMLPALYNEKLIDGELWKSTTFGETVRMSAYLLAFVVCDFSFEDANNKLGIQTRIYARNETIENGEAKYALRITPVILDYFEKYFAVKYPLQKADQFALPDFGAAAMENWGLIIYRESYLLYDKSTTSILDKLYITNTIAHELAHMWFGNLVSPAWWDDVWLNEGFATYLALLGQARVQPAWQTDLPAVNEILQSVLRIDSLVSSHPLVQEVNSPNEIMSQFDLISYFKGSSILRMINAFMGETNFKSGLTKYLNNLAYETATHSDLFQYWEDQVQLVDLKLPASMHHILETWTLQMGYPLVSVKKQEGSNKYLISQEYFLQDPSLAPVQTVGSKKYGYKWFVPFTFKRIDQPASEKYSQRWLTPEQPTPLVIWAEGYILGNINALGYYRVNYDDDTWSKLIDKLKSETYSDISIANRAQLIDDAFNIANSGYLDITVPMDMSLYLSNETDGIPWRSFFKNIEYLDEMLGRSHLYGVFSDYVLDQLSAVMYNENTWKERDRSDSAMMQRLSKMQAIEIACRYGNKHCIRRAKQLFARWKRNPDNGRIVSSTFRNSVYCTAIRHGTAEDWNFAWHRLLVSKNAQEEDSLRHGLSCSREPWILARYIDFCLDPTFIRPSNAISGCLVEIANTEYGRDLVWSRLHENWETIMKTYGSGSPRFSAIIGATTKRFSTNYELQMIQNFKAIHKDLGAAAREVDQAIEKTKFNIKWRMRNQEKLEKWLKQYNVKNRE